MDLQGKDNEADEISKKEALQQAGISYGQFYRWKRMGLIPEAWFHRRSTFTGQETFLPRAKLMERIRRIQELKDRYSLEEIAEMLSPGSARHGYTREELERAGMIGPRTGELFPGFETRMEFGFADLLALRVIARLAEQGTLADEAIRLAAETLLERFHELNPSAPDRALVVVRREGALLAALHTGTCLFDRDTEVLASVDLGRLIEEINLSLRTLAE